MPTRKTTSPDLAVTAEDEAAIEADAEKVVAHAKASFSLADRLNGMKLATTKVLVFTDLAAAEVWAQQEVKVQRLAAVSQTYKAGTEEYDAAAADFTEADDALEAARDVAFASALAIHMRALPQVAFEAAKRKARTMYADDAGNIPEDKQPDYYEAQNEILLGRVVTRIVDATGAEATFERKTLATDLREALGVPQYQRVIEAFNALMFNDTLSRAATSDPGF